jgi:hypothetical protein
MDNVKALQARFTELFKISTWCYDWDPTTLQENIYNDHQTPLP